MKKTDPKKVSQKEKVIPFDAQQRLLEQARRYLASPSLVFQDRERAVSVLLKALRAADLDLRREIILILGGVAKEKIYWPLYEILKDEKEPDELRDQAAIHLAVIGPFLDDPQGLNRRLIADLEQGDIDLRVRAIMALGWEGNIAAAVPLIECMYDSSPEIQEMAVNALCNLKDGRLMGLLADRIEKGSFEQKRAILFNLWRFRERQEEVAAIYRRVLEEEDPALRQDVLALLGEIGRRPENVDLYRRLLVDENPGVRALALERLYELREMDPGCLPTDELLEFLDDESMEVKRTALCLIQALKEDGSGLE